jgi:hypothetical protein
MPATATCPAQGKEAREGQSCGPPVELASPFEVEATQRFSVISRVQTPLPKDLLHAGKPTDPLSHTCVPSLYLVCNMTISSGRLLLLLASFFYAKAVLYATCS